MAAHIRITDLDLRRPIIALDLDDCSINSEDSNSSTSDFDTYSSSSEANTPRSYYNDYCSPVTNIASQINALSVNGLRSSAKRSLVDAFSRADCHDDDYVDTIRLTRSYSDLPDIMAQDKENTLENTSVSNPQISCDDLSALSSPNTLRKKKEFILRAGRVRSTSRTSECNSGVKTKKKPKPSMLARSVEIEKTLTPSKIHLPITKTDLHLPCIRGKLPEFNTLSGETVCKLIDGVFDSIDNFIIVDCRYQYEFDGGHIRGAVNIWDETNLKNYFFSTPPAPNKTTVVIFHCEFSSKRGPDAYKKVRGWDRRINWERNGGLNLLYPELYLLEGGYATFYEKYQGYCNGEYTRMNDKCIPTETKQRATKLHKLTKRSNSFAGYELRTSTSPSKIVGQLETHSSDSQLIITESHSAPSSSRGEASEERGNVAPVMSHKPLTAQRRINSLNHSSTCICVPSLLSPRITHPPRNTPTLLTGRASLTSTLEIDYEEEEQMQIDESLSSPSSGVNSPRLTPAPMLGKLANPKSKSCSSLEHVLPTVYEDD
jgi:hypothetical protein